MTSPGIDTLLEDPQQRRRIAGSRSALVCHAASVCRDATYAFDRLCALPDLRPDLLLVPEHGLFGEQVYMEAVPDAVDPRLGLPVLSLYGDGVDSLAPPPGLLDGLDVVLFDLQDVGTRYYTYLATMAMVMDRCAALGIRFVVLDRPNPIGGVEVEGNVPLPGMQSFVSHLPLANRHGMTAGEVARLHAATAGLDIDLEVVPCRGWTRDMHWADTALPFVPPSPNIPAWETALVYPGMCLLEGTNVSEGRGTTTPFLVFGAPFVRDPWALAAALGSLELPGVTWRPTFFRPDKDKGAAQRCGGCQLVLRDVRAFLPLLTGMAVVWALARACPDAFALRTDAYEFVTDRLAIDLLLGDPSAREALLAGEDPRDVHAAFASARDGFLEARAPHLLYPGAA